MVWLSIHEHVVGSSLPGCPPSYPLRFSDHARAICLVRVDHSRRRRREKVLLALHELGHAAVRQGLHDMDERWRAVRGTLSPQSGNAPAGDSTALDAIRGIR